MNCLRSYELNIVSVSFVNIESVFLTASFKKSSWWDFLVGPVREYLPCNAGDMVQCLVWEEPTFLGATKPSSHNKRSCMLQLRPRQSNKIFKSILVTCQHRENRGFAGGARPQELFSLCVSPLSLFPTSAGQPWRVPLGNLSVNTSTSLHLGAFSTGADLGP